MIHLSKKNDLSLSAGPYCPIRVKFIAVSSTKYICRNFTVGQLPLTILFTFIQIGWIPTNLHFFSRWFTPVQTAGLSWNSGKRASELTRRKKSLASHSTGREATITMMRLKTTKWNPCFYPAWFGGLETRVGVSTAIQNPSLRPTPWCPGFRWEEISKNGWLKTLVH